MHAYLSTQQIIFLTVWI